MVIGFECLGGIGTQRIFRQYPVGLKERLGLAGLPSSIEKSGEQGGGVDGVRVRRAKECPVEFESLDKLKFGPFVLAERGVSRPECLMDGRLNLGFVVKVADDPRGGSRTSRRLGLLERGL